jgi:hypothetical protein
MGRRPAEAPASDHRHRGAKAALELTGQLMGTGHGHGAQLADGLAAAADVDGEALMGIGLDAIRVDVHHQGADLAARSGADRHRGRCEGHRPRARRRHGGKDRGSGPA